jgi:hypothetical protein
VWFNQASMIQSAEVGHHTLKAARLAGVDTTTDFQMDADTCLSTVTSLSTLTLNQPT